MTKWHVYYLLQFESLTDSSQFAVVSSCCNNESCGEVVQEMVTTELLSPKPQSQLYLTNYTDTSVTLVLPSVSAGDANMWV